MEANIVYLFQKEVTTDTLKVAEVFHKEHRTVLRSVDKVIKNSPLAQHSFVLSKYKDVSGKYNKYYRLNRDGFLLLLMNMRGKEVLSKQIQFINLFNKLEEVAKEVTSPEYIAYKNHVKVGRLNFTDTVKEYVEYAKSQGSSGFKYYYKIFTKDINQALFGLNSLDRNTLPSEYLQKIELAELSMSSILKSEMDRNTPYKKAREIAVTKLRFLIEPIDITSLQCQTIAS